MSAFSAQYNIYKDTSERAVEQFCAGMRYEPPVLAESMKYSLLSGGKRLRSVLFYAVLDAHGMDFRGERELAVALECIHTYSLIHDDLPAMDNDDLRRGKPSNHKVFGEGNAILAGDALLSAAFDLLLTAGGKSARHLRAAQAISRAAGAEGMVAGQSADLLYEGKDVGKEELFFVVSHKTGCLIAAPVVAATVLAGGDERSAETFGRALGALFQITDDILDVKGESNALGKTPGKDEKENKLTSVKIFGLDGAERIADEYAEKATAALGGWNIDGGFLRALVASVRRRDR